MTRALNFAYLTFGLVIGLLIAAPRAQVENFRKALEPEQRLHLEAGYGKCRGTRAPEGTWYQSEQTHQLQLSDKCGEAGLRWDLVNDAYLSVRYVNLGQFAVRSVANNDPQDRAELRGSINSDHTRPECSTKNTGSENPLKEDCHYTWNGSGTLYGFAATIGAQPLKLGALRVGPEAGIFLYRATWRMTITPIAGGWDHQYDQKTKWILGPTAGVRADWKWLYTAARWSWVPDKIVPVYKAPVRELVVGVSIPI